MSIRSTRPLSADLDEKIIEIRKRERLADHEIAHRLQISEWQVRKAIRAYRKVHPHAKLKAHRWSPNSAAAKRMALASKLVEENALTHKQILQRTGYRSWRACLAQVRIHRKRVGLAPLTYTSGYLKVGCERSSFVQLVLYGAAIRAARWSAGGCVTWMVVGQTLILRTGSHDRRYLFGDNGHVMVVQTVGRFRLKLMRPIQLLGWEYGDCVYWRVARPGVLELTRVQTTSTQART